MSDRVAFLADPGNGTPQAIAAFASLHVAMSFTALIAVYLLDLGRRWKQFLWGWVVLTFIATVYLGWHYVVDDVAGLLMAVVAVGLALADHRVRSAAGRTDRAPFGRRLNPRPGGIDAGRG